MRIIGDYHTHTVYSHGHGSIEENVRAAVAAGLSEIAITDHGFWHRSYGVRRMDISAMLTDIQRLRIEFPQISIYSGLETNLVGLDGRVDIEDEDIKWMDIMVCGYHKYTRSGDLGQVFNFKLPNMYSAIGKISSKQIVKNTDAYIKALERYPIDIISHPNYGIKTDVREIAKACRHYGTFMELNGKKVSMSDSEIISILEEDVMLIIDSDAHSPEKVGKFTVPMSYVERLGISPDRIANMDKVPLFRGKRERSNL